jgi:hypothetical protein
VAVLVPAAGAMGREQDARALRAASRLRQTRMVWCRERAAAPGPSVRRGGRPPDARLFRLTLRRSRGEVSRSRLMAACRASSLMAGLGPRLAGGAAGTALVTRAA